MNNFHKTWIQATVAPEAITTIKQNKDTYLDCIRNEDKSKRVFVLSNNQHIIAIGTDYNQLVKSPYYSYSEGLSLIVKHLSLYQAL